MILAANQTVGKGENVGRVGCLGASNRKKAGNGQKQGIQLRREPKNLVAARRRGDVPFSCAQGSSPSSGNLRLTEADLFGRATLLRRAQILQRREQTCFEFQNFRSALFSSLPCS